MFFDGEGGLVVLVGVIDVVSFGFSLVGKGFGSMEVGEEVVVGGEDVEFIGGFFFVLFWQVRCCFLFIVGKNGIYVVVVWLCFCVGCGVFFGKV